MLAFRHPLQLTKSRNRKTMKILFSWFLIQLFYLSERNV